MVYESGRPVFCSSLGPCTGRSHPLIEKAWLESPYFETESMYSFLIYGWISRYWGVWTYLSQHKADLVDNCVAVSKQFHVKCAVRQWLTVDQDLDYNVWHFYFCFKSIDHLGYIFWEWWWNQSDRSDFQAAPNHDQQVSLGFVFSDALARQERI